MKQETNENRLETESKRLELALRASNEGIWDWYPGVEAIHYTRRILEFLECGESRAPNIFLNPYPHIHEDDRAAFAKAMRQALANGGPETLAVDARVRTGSGGWRWLRIRGTVVRDRGGEVVRIAGSMIDISQRKAAEEALDEERNLLRQLIDHVPMQIYFKDSESRFVMCNQGLADWHGRASPNELLGMHDRDLFDESHWRPAERDEQEIMRSGEPIMNKLEQETWRTRDETWVITSKFPWLDRSGGIRGTFGISSDVTELVHARQRASELAAQLQLRNQAYEEELLLAREIQQAFAVAGFPEVAVGGRRLAFGSRHIPISGMAGDFHEVLDVGRGRAGLLICDVMGHGVRSALVVAMLRGLLEKQRMTAGMPGAFLCGLNDGLASILERAGVTMFATAFYGVLDVTSGEFVFGCAGHPGPVVCEAGGSARQIAVERAARGPALGLLRDADFPESTIRLKAPARLLLHTDGVLEAENPEGDLFGNHLAEIAAATAGRPLEQALDEILGAVLEFSGAQGFDDDVCLLGCDLPA